MSGVAALISPSGGLPPDPKAQDRLIQSLHHRGQNGLRSWREGPAVLVQAHSTGGPAGHSFDTDGPVVVAGDIRLDNRGELRRSLSLDPAASDADCVVAAYLKWGTAFCDRLRGDFALALWDRRTATLVAARDLVGVRPLYYAEHKGSLRLASAPAAIALAEARPLDERRMAGYLAGHTDTDEETSFPGVRRLAPGHVLIFGPGGCRTEHFASLDPGAEVEDPETAFREAFDAAVAARLDAARHPAALLSGGLDSSAICAVGASVSDAPLPTYSLVHGHFPEIDESTHIDALLDRFGPRLAPVRVSMPDHAPLAGLPEMMEIMDGPYEAPGLLKSVSLYRRIAADGCDVVLNGHGGDEVVGHGIGRLVDLARAGRWLQVLALAPACARIYGSHPAELTLALLARFGPSHRGRQAFGAASRRFGGTARAPLWRRAMRPEVLHRTELDASTPASGAQDEPARHLETVRSPLMARSFEIYDRATAHAGIEARYPFFDTALVRLCLALPSTERLRRDGTRSILRRALRDHLPRRIARRQDKVGFAPELATGLVRHHGDVLDRIGSATDTPLAAYLDPAVLREAIAGMRAAPTETEGDVAMFIWRAASLHLWLTNDTPSEKAAA